MRAQPDGFDLTYTKPVDAKTTGDPASYSMKCYTTIYQSSYGSPEVDGTTPTIKAVTVAPDKLGARLVIDGIVPGNVHELHASGVRSAKDQPLLHETACYTLNNVPTK